jgi:hypothetical protein
MTLFAALTAPSQQAPTPQQASTIQQADQLQQQFLRLKQQYDATSSPIFL